MCACLLKHSFYVNIFFLRTNKHFALQGVNGKSHVHALCMIKTTHPYKYLFSVPMSCMEFQCFIINYYCFLIIQV